MRNALMALSLLALLVAACLSVTFYFALGSGGDLSRPDEEGLQSEPPTPGEENGYRLLVEAADSIESPERGVLDALQAWLESPSNETREPDDALTRWVDDDRAFRGRLDRGLRSGSVRYEGDESGFGHDSRIPRSLVLASRILAESVTSYERGEEESAIIAALDLARFGRLLLGSAGPSRLHGWVAQKMGLRALRVHIGRTTLPAERLEEWLPEILSLGADIAAWENCLRRNHELAAEAVDDITSGNWANLGMDAPSAAVMARWQPNRAKRHFASNTRGEIEALSLPYADLPEAEERDVLAISMLDELRFVPDSDRMGVAFRRCEIDFDVRATAILLAIRCHRDREGSGPDSLAELVPRYLEEVPTDPFGGSAIEFDPRTGHLSSPIRSEIAPYYWAGESTWPDILSWGRELR